MELYVTQLFSAFAVFYKQKLDLCSVYVRIAIVSSILVNYLLNALMFTHPHHYANNYIGGDYVRLVCFW